MPGLIELHTDHLEPHIMPRPSVDWHPMSAVLAYDAQIAASGITTVFDSLRLGVDERKASVANSSHALGRTIYDAQHRGLLRAEHRTHLRCEIASPDVVDSLCAFLEVLPVHLVSLMDHTPGQRQFRDIEKLRIYYRGKGGMSEPQLQDYIAHRVALGERYSVLNRRALVAAAKRNGVSLASHDDTTLEHVRESVEDGVMLAEFPTTTEAACASHKAGIAVMMGAPNLVRGGSHSGNVSAVELARLGTLDIFSSDYVPTSLLQAVFRLPHVADISLPRAVGSVTAAPAEVMGLTDRGTIEAGKRADLVQVDVIDDLPVVRRVWREGRRVV